MELKDEVQQHNVKLPSGSLSSLYKLLLWYDEEIQKYGKLRLITRIKAFFSGLKITDRSIIESSIQRKEYEHVVSSIDRLKKNIALFENSYKKYQEISLEFLKSFLADKFGRHKSRKVFERKDMEFNDSQNFLKDYPIVTSTTFSATTNINPVVPFDYLIMDEAAQVDISAGALALNCVKSAVIVGDPKQLPNVVEEKDAK